MTALQLATTSAIPGLMLKGTILLLLAWFGALLLRRAPAGVRHGVWLTAIVGVLLVPTVARVAAVRVPVLPVPRLSPQPASVGAAPLSLATKTTTSATSQTNPQGALAGGRQTISETSVTALAVALWLSVSAAVVAWLIVGVVKVRRLLGRARILHSGGWAQALKEATDEMKITRSPRLLESDEVETAFACGIFKPAIVFPRSAEEWSDDRRRAVLLHEAAHIRRGDLLGHVIASLGCALYWFHPLMWLAAHRLRAEGELACDEMVLDAGVRPSEYAQHLLDLVTGLGGRTNAPALALPMARSRAFEGRMQAILERTNRWRLGSGERGLLFGLFALLSASIAAVSPVPRAAAIQLPLEPPPSDTIGDSASLGRLAPHILPRAPISQEDGARAFPLTSDRSGGESTMRRARSSEAVTEAARTGVPVGVLAGTPCQRVVGNQQVPALVDSAYARLFDGIALTSDRENKVCEVLLRLHFEQLAADSITAAGLQLSRARLEVLQAQRNALLRGLLTNEADRATLDDRTRRMGLRVGSLRMLPTDSLGAQRGTGGGRGRGGGGAPPTLDSVTGVVIGGGRIGRGRGVDPSVIPASGVIDRAAELNARVAILLTGFTFERLFDGIALTADQEASAREIIAASEREERTIAAPRRLLRNFRLAPVSGLITLHPDAMAELMAIMPTDADRASLQSRIIVVQP